ncbi:hypothetical protein SLE2022_146120 [Rubroshorea leprosula]
MPRTLMLFKKPLKPTDITKRLAIPTKSLGFFPHFNGGYAVKLNIRYESRVWPMACSTRKQGHKKPVLSKGWLAFVRKNHFNVGDVVALYKEEDEAGILWYRMEVDRATIAPSSDGNLGVLAQETEFKQLGKACYSKQTNLGLVLNKSCLDEVVPNLDLTLAPPAPSVELLN